MREWIASEEWLGQDAYVVGGGPSLQSFDWWRLCKRNVIGCNCAFLLGHEIVDICIFADQKWWKEIGEKGTEDFGGRVVGVAEDSRMRHELCPWLMLHSSQAFGLSRSRLGYNGNTGSLALNLALILGASRVFLLGFDMKLSEDGHANWHDIRCESPQAEVYARFQEGFRRVAEDLPKVFPGREVWNVTDDSNLDVFPKVSLEAHFGRSVARKERVPA